MDDINNTDEQQALTVSTIEREEEKRKIRIGFETLMRYHLPTKNTRYLNTTERHLPIHTRLTLLFRRSRNYMNATPFKCACQVYGSVIVNEVVEDILTDWNLSVDTYSRVLLSSAIDNDVHLDCVNFLLRREPDILQTIVSSPSFLFSSSLVLRSFPTNDTNSSNMINNNNDNSAIINEDMSSSTVVFVDPQEKCKNAKSVNGTTHSCTSTHSHSRHRHQRRERSTDVNVAIAAIQASSDSTMNSQDTTEKSTRQVISSSYSTSSDTLSKRSTEPTNRKRSAADDDVAKTTVITNNNNKKKKRELKGAVTEYQAALLAITTATVSTSATATASTTATNSTSTNILSYSNEYVSSRFLNAYPEYNETPTSTAAITPWIPVNKVVGDNTRLSPQSGKALALLREYYGNETKAWNNGWRWVLLEHNHQWYPPTFEKENKSDDDSNDNHNDNDTDKVEEYNELVKRYSRGGKNKGSISSGKIKEVLDIINIMV